MLEKISVLILLTLIDATANCDDFEFYLKNTSQYLYNNFLNFIDSILNRYGASNSSKTDVNREGIGINCAKNLQIINLILRNYKTSLPPIA